MAIDATRWERIQGVFHAAFEHPEADRRAFVEREAAQDLDLAERVLALLQADARSTSLLDRGVAEVASVVLEGASLTARNVGPYRIVRMLGQGGMGVVYLAEREDLRSRAAIKVLRDAWLSPDRRERFASEQRTLAQLNHPSIARLYDANALPDGTPCLVMEYVEGTPLTTHCRARSAPIPERLRLFRAVCDAVQYAHRHAVIHRDLKPSNVLVTEEGAVKLLDFGISKQLESVGRPADQTQGVFAMTPAYAAPEQVRGEPIGIHTDIYALGVILYELLADRLPLDLTERTPGQAEAMILEHEPPRPSAVSAIATGSLGRAAWSDLDVLCMTAMHKDPQRRYHTVEALVQDIDRFLSGQPLHARPDNFGYRLGKFLRRNRRSVAAAGTVVAGVVVLITFYTVRLARARDDALAEAARTERIQAFTMSLFEGGDDAVGPADSLRVISLIDRGVQQARALDAEPELQVELLLTLGGIYQKLGKLDRADSLFTAALERGRARSGPDHADVGANLVALGLLRADQARVVEAERLAREGLETLERQRASDHASVIRARTALGQVLTAAGKYDEAIGVLAAVVADRSGAERPNRAESEALTLLANAHFYAGHHLVSDSLNRTALAMDRALYGERHPVIADGLINLGAIQFDLGNYAEAEALYREALEIFQAYHGPDHPQTASNLNMLGRSLVFLNRYDEAEEMLRRALAVRERVYGPVHPAVASTLNELGNIAIGRKDYGTAEAHFSRMERIYRLSYPEGHYLIGIALSNRASAYMSSEQYARAEPVFREAIEVFTRTLSAEHLNTGIARIKLGRVLVRQQRHAEAEDHLRAGYGIVSAQSNPSVSWLRAAREDLVSVYEVLGRSEEANRYRAELAGAGGRLPVP